MVTENEMKCMIKQKGQEYLFYFYEKLSKEEQNSFLEQLEKIDFDYMNRLYQTTKESNTFQNGDRKITPITALDKAKIPQDELIKLNQMGETLIKDGKLAICSMAGGQGTRLRF